MGRPLAAPLRASFGPAGGTLGRSPDCTLALPDENRHISRQQARIDIAGGVASIVCLSAANPLIVNGQALRQGQSLLGFGEKPFLPAVERQRRPIHQVFLTVEIARQPIHNQSPNCAPASAELLQP